MTDRAELRSLLLRSREQSDAHMSAIRNASPLSYELLHQQLYQYVLAKFLLTDGDRPEDDSFDALVDASLAQSMKVSPELVAEFDTAKSCDGATSAMAKKVLLFMSIQRALGIELPALESARVKAMDELSSMVWKTLAREIEWREKMDL